MFPPCIVHLITNVGGKRHEESTGIRLTGKKGPDRTAMNLAESIRRKRELEVIAGLYGFTTSGREQTLLEYVKLFSEEREETQAYKTLPYLEKFGGGALYFMSCSGDSAGSF